MDDQSEVSLTWTDSESDDEPQIQPHDIDNEQMDVDEHSKSPSLSVYTQSIHKSAMKKRRKIDKEINDIMYVYCVISHYYA